MNLDIHVRDDLLEFFPNFEYFNCKQPHRLDFSLIDNLVGMQQEAFILYWILKQLREHYGVGLDIGCGQDPHLACIGVNDYCGEQHPIYGGRYSPQITGLAEQSYKLFNKNTFSFIVMSHILEHVCNPIIVFRQWCKLLCKDGIMILLMPDARYEKGKWDPTHKNFYTPEDFEQNIIKLNTDLIKTEVFNDLHNFFSLNYVGRRI